MPREKRGPNLRSREEFLAYAKEYVTAFLKGQEGVGRPVSVRYIREWCYPTGEFRTVVGRDGTERVVPVVDKGGPCAVMVAYRDEHGDPRFGWSARSSERDEGTIIYRRGRHAGKIRDFSTPVEKKSFSRVEGLFRAIRRAQGSTNGWDAGKLPSSVYGEAYRFVGHLLAKESGNIAADSGRTTTA